MQGDLTECKHQFVLHNLPEPRFLAYPFSAHEDAENPARAAMLSSIVTPLYQAALLDQADVVAVTTADNIAGGNISRMDVTADVTPEKWIDKLVKASPLDPKDAHPLADRDGWTDSNQKPTQDGEPKREPRRDRPRVQGVERRCEYAALPHSDVEHLHGVCRSGFRPRHQWHHYRTHCASPAAPTTRWTSSMDRGYFSSFQSGKHRVGRVQSGELPDQAIVSPGRGGHAGDVCRYRSMVWQLDATPANGRGARVGGYRAASVSSAIA